MRAGWIGAFSYFITLYTLMLISMDSLALCGSHEITMNFLSFIFEFWQPLLKGAAIVAPLAAVI
jgi:hypothetical protein